MKINVKDLFSFIISDKPSPSLGDNTEGIYIDYYKEARDSYLKSKMPEYPNINSFDIFISFTISSSAKNGVIVHAILDTMPTGSYLIDKNKISINPKGDQLTTCLQAMADILAVVKSWKSTVILCNGAELNYTGFFYFLNYYEEKYGVKEIYRNTPQGLSKQYVSKNRTQRKTTKPALPTVHISRSDPESALENLIDRYIELFGKNKEIVVKQIPKKGKVVVIEDSLIVYFWVSPRYWSALKSRDHRDWEYPYIMIQELTHNDLFKFNFSGFKKNFICDYIGIDFYAFHGLDYYVKDIDRFKLVNKTFPELELIKRFEQYPGEKHHFIILRIEDPDGKMHFGVGETKRAIHSFILKLCSELEEKNSRSLELNGASCLPYAENRDFIAAFLSWKGKPKKWRLENMFSYSYEDMMIKNDSDLSVIPSEIIRKAKKGEYNDLEYGTYSKPANRWKSEELVYNITKKLYKDYQVIYQYSPYFLSTDKGCMSYDIYICGLKIAIEYQGKQHFEPVDYFGGKENFEKQQERDRLKAERSKENGVNLIYINYWESITPDLIRERIEADIRIPVIKN